MSLLDNTLTFAGGESLPVSVVGQFLRVRDATSPIYITINGSGEIKREKGEQINLGVNYKTLKIDVRSVVAQTVTITSAAEHQDDSRASINATISTVVEAGNDNAHAPKVTIGAGSSALLIAANTTRKSIRVSMLSAAAGYVTLGKSGVASGTGGTLEPGMVDYMDTQGALYAYNPNGVAVDVYVMEINKL